MVEFTFHDPLANSKWLEDEIQKELLKVLEDKPHWSNTKYSYEISVVEGFIYYEIFRDGKRFGKGFVGCIERAIHLATFLIADRKERDETGR